MANIPELLSDLLGTFQSYFQIGPKATYLRLKNVSGDLDLKNTLDSGNINLSALGSKAVAMQPTNLTQAYVVPADYQVNYIVGYIISTGGSITISGEVHTRL